MSSERFLKEFPVHKKSTQFGRWNSRILRVYSHQFAYGRADGEGNFVEARLGKSPVAFDRIDFVAQVADLFVRLTVKEKIVKGFDFRFSSEEERNEAFELLQGRGGTGAAALLLEGAHIQQTERNELVKESCSDVLVSQHSPSVSEAHSDPVSASILLPSLRNDHLVLIEESCSGTQSLLVASCEISEVITGDASKEGAGVPEQQSETNERDERDKREEHDEHDERDLREKRCESEERKNRDESREGEEGASEEGNPEGEIFSVKTQPFVSLSAFETAVTRETPQESAEQGSVVITVGSDEIVVLAADRSDILTEQQSGPAALVPCTNFQVDVMANFGLCLCGSDRAHHPPETRDVTPRRSSVAPRGVYPNVKQRSEHFQSFLNHSAKEERIGRALSYRPSGHRMEPQLKPS